MVNSVADAGGACRWAHSPASRKHSIAFIREYRLWWRCGLFDEPGAAARSERVRHYFCPAYRMVLVSISVLADDDDHIARDAIEEATNTLE